MLQLSPQLLSMLRSAQAVTDEKLQEARIAAAREKAGRKLNRARERMLVDRVCEVLKAGIQSKFEFEASCRHGLRRALCLESWGWKDADRAAEEVVRKALSRLGAERPTWQQGQPEWTEDGFSPIERTRCVTCGGELEEGDKKYCSHSCSMIAAHHRAKVTGLRMDRAEYLAAIAARKEERIKGGEKDCENCGKAFTPTDYYWEQRYCGRACASEAAKRPEQACVWCETMFRPSKADSKYCSVKCFGSAMQTPERACKQCASMFKPHNPRSLYCCLDCSRMASRKEREPIQCPVCKAVFRKRFPSDMKTYCSPACSQLARRLSRTGIICVEAPPMAPERLDPINGEVSDG